MVEQLQTALGGNLGLALGYTLLAVLSSQLVLMACSAAARMMHERRQQQVVGEGEFRREFPGAARQARG